MPQITFWEARSLPCTPRKDTRAPPPRARHQRSPLRRARRRPDRGLGRHRTGDRPTQPSSPTRRARSTSAAPCRPPCARPRLSSRPCGACPGARVSWDPRFGTPRTVLPLRRRPVRAAPGHGGRSARGPGCSDNAALLGLSTGAVGALRADRRPRPAGHRDARRHVRAGLRRRAGHPGRQPQRRRARQRRGGLVRRADDARHRAGGRPEPVQRAGPREGGRRARRGHRLHPGALRHAGRLRGVRSRARSRRPRT